MTQCYIGKISGPLMDRIDIHIDVPAAKFIELRARGTEQADTIDEIRERVIRARQVQLARLNGERDCSKLRNDARASALWMPKARLSSRKQRSAKVFPPVPTIVS